MRGGDYYYDRIFEQFKYTHARSFREFVQPST